MLLHVLAGLLAGTCLATNSIQHPCPDCSAESNAADCIDSPHKRDALAGSIGSGQDRLDVNLSSKDFTSVFVTDTQFMVMDVGHRNVTQADWIAQVDWIVGQRKSLNISAVVHSGDLVEHSNETYQWQNLLQGWNKIVDIEIPWAMVPGNHDFSNITKPWAENRWDVYNRYMGPVWRRNRHLVSHFPARRYENTVVFFEASGLEFMVVGIELGPSWASLNWASDQLRRYPRRHAILNNHFTPWGKERGINFIEWARQHRNVFMIHNGHDCAREWHRRVHNYWGDPIMEILTDYQCTGDGFLRYYVFRPTANRVDAFTYSPKLGRFETDGNSQFSFDFAMGSSHLRSGIRGLG